MSIVKDFVTQSVEEKELKLSSKDTVHEKRQPKTLGLFSMEDKVVVVTGGARGLGLTFVRAFLESGCSSIAIIDLRREDADESAKVLMKEFGPDGQKLDVVGYACDVSKEEVVQQVMQSIVDRFGKIDTLVTSAGIVENFPALEYPTHKIQKLYDVNVHGSFYCAREVARHMIKTGTHGSMVLIASMSANIVNVPQYFIAVKHMAASLAVEWAQYGIRVNALSPGYMLTPLTVAVLEKAQDMKVKWESLTPVGRMGDPEDLKGSVIYLASDASRFTTGTELRVDGGYTAV
ncbi:hypothetical protein FRB96_008526 [Tulasnella sp. 330]|nr:hypothetical protein FRB96_008526 [Tulasnella sp. 330]KAG8879404.1 hypothetical protein FRB97_001631 [Tulasnella sp. 331]KAG8884693.1 hypothetical protein FRB98_002260 [Tulasnella sp. 332]